MLRVRERQIQRPKAVPRDARFQIVRRFELAERPLHGDLPTADRTDEDVVDCILQRLASPPTPDFADRSATTRGRAYPAAAARSLLFVREYLRVPERFDHLRRRLVEVRGNPDPALQPPELAPALLFAVRHQPLIRFAGPGDHDVAASKIESALLIARDPTPPARPVVVMRSTEVADRDRITFLKTGQTTTERHVERPVRNPPGGDLWVPPLPQLWNHLESAPRLSDYFNVHRGIQWKSSQGDAGSNEPKAGYKPGLHNAGRARQFRLQDTVFLDCRRERLLYKAIDLPWDRTKLVVNAARLSIRSWRIAAMLDRNGLVCSQQFFGLWPKRQLTDAQLPTFVAVLNGPIANAFLATHSPAKGIRISTVKQIPMPSTLPFQVEKLVAEYVRCLQASAVSNVAEEQMQNILTLIDAAVLDAYDMPARLEHELLEFFRGSDRPVAHPWRHWDDHNPAPGLTPSLGGGLDRQSDGKEASDRRERPVDMRTGEGARLDCRHGRPSHESNLQCGLRCSPSPGLNLDRCRECVEREGLISPIPPEPIVPLE